MQSVVEAARARARATASGRGGREVGPLWGARGPAATGVVGRPGPAAAAPLTGEEGWGGRQPRRPTTVGDGVTPRPTRAALCRGGSVVAPTHRPPPLPHRTPPTAVGALPPMVIAQQSHGRPLLTSPCDPPLPTMPTAAAQPADPSTAPSSSSTRPPRRRRYRSPVTVHTYRSTGASPPSSPTPPPRCSPSSPSTRARR